MTDLTEYHLSMADYFELQKYRRALEEGRLMILPVPIGETVYQVVKTDRRYTARPHSKPVYHIRITTVTWNNLRHVVKDFGKTVFADHREALAAKEATIVNNRAQACEMVQKHCQLECPDRNRKGCTNRCFYDLVGRVEEILNRRDTEQPAEGGAEE